MDHPNNSDRQCRIAVEAMGGDFAPTAAVLGAGVDIDGGSPGGMTEEGIDPKIAESNVYGDNHYHEQIIDRQDKVEFKGNAGSIDEGSIYGDYTAEKAQEHIDGNGEQK